MKTALVNTLSITIVIATAILIRPALAAEPPANQTLYYESNGHRVAADLARPAMPGRHPAVLLLHGRGGLSFYGPGLVQLARALTDHGLIVLTPHYFDASGSADNPEVTAERFEIWRKAVGDALTFAARLPEVDPKRIGVVGVSLGGFIAGVQSAQDDRVAVLVSESSGVSTYFPSQPVRMAPLLIVHSREDAIVPLADAEHLADIARGFGVEPEFALYDGRKHVLTGDVAQEADERIVSFLTRVLRPSVP